MSNEKAEERLKAGFQDWELPPEEPNKPGTPADGGQHARADDDIKWPTMDDAAYRGFAGEVVRTIEPHTEADPVALLIQLLTCFGNIIGRTRHYYRFDIGRQQANLFTGIVGQTAKARKGTSYINIRDGVVAGADPDWDRDHIQNGLSSGEGLIHIVRDPMFKPNKETGQQVEIDPGVSDKRQLIQEPEFASVLTVMTRAGNTLSPIMRKAWDGTRLQTLTRQSPLKATDPHISIIGHITIDELRACLTRTDMASGFANRFLFALVKRSKFLADGGNLNFEQIVRMRTEFKSIVDAVKGDPFDETARLTMTEEAKAEWRQVYPALTAERPGLLGAIMQRGEPQTIRLALIYALLDRANQIDLPHLQAALALWRYCEASTVFIFGATLGDEVADTILRALKNAGRDGMTRSMIYDLYGGRQSKERISAALGLLQEKGWARTAPRTSGGRPTEMWFKK
jgi:hypothetical protein